MEDRIVYKVNAVKIDDLKTAKFNPSRRTAPKSLTGLMSSISAHGMPVPIVITEDGRVGDGHRRLACARLLGWETVPAVVWKGKTAEQIWSMLNAHQMSMSKAQWLEAVVCGMSVNQPEIPRQLANDIRELLSLLDADTVWRLVEDGRSPDILATAKYINRKLDWGADDKGRLVKTIMWLIDFNASNKARNIISGAYDMSVLAEAIETHRDFDFEVVLK